MKEMDIIEKRETNVKEVKNKDINLRRTGSDIEMAWQQDHVTFSLIKLRLVIWPEQEAGNKDPATREVDKYVISRNAVISPGQL